MLKKVFSNTFFQMITKIFTAIIWILLIKILVSFFSVENYWVYNKVLNYLSIFAFLADLWLYTIVIRELNKMPKKSEKIISSSLFLRFSLWIAIIFLSLFIGYFLPWYWDNLTLSLIFIVWIFTLVSLINSSILSVMQAHLKTEFSLFSNVFWKLIILFWTYLSLNYFDKIEQETWLYIVFLALLFWTFITTILNFLYARKIDKFSFNFDFDYIKYLFKISLPYWLALFLSVVYFKADIFLLSIIEPKTLADISVALYSLPMRIVEVLMLFWMFFLNSMLPLFTQTYENKEYKNLEKLINNSIYILLGLSWILFSATFLLKDYAIKVLANDSYIVNSLHNYSSSDVFSIVVWILVFYFMSQIFIYLMIASWNQKYLLKINFIVAMFNIIWNIFAIKYLSFVWAWIITLLSQILLLLLSFSFIRKKINFSIDYKYIFKLIFISFFSIFSWKIFIDYYYISSEIISIFVYFIFIFFIYFWLFVILNPYILKK